MLSTSSDWARARAAGLCAMRQLVSRLLDSHLLLALTLQHLEDEVPMFAGNLVDMGKLAFAPASPEVLKLAAHLDKTHEFFGQSFHGVFRHSSCVLCLSGLHNGICMV